MSDLASTGAGEKAGPKPGTFTKGDSRINRTKPGPGRTPDKIRAALRLSFDKRRKALDKFAASDDPAVAMKALEMMAKYGIGTTFTPTDEEGKTLRNISVTHQVVDAGER